MCQGTWQYMSVALLNRPTKVVEIPDDHESLFYVLLYHAVRYLKSNCANVPNWLEDFFDVFSYQDGAYGCGARKEQAIDSGRLIVKSGTRLQFSSPLDELLDRLLRSFQAYYAIKMYDEEQEKKSMLTKLPTTSSSSKAQAMRPRGRKPPRRMPAADKQELAQLPCAPSKKPNETPPPTAEDRELAGSVSNALAFLHLLHEYTVVDWAADDKEGDQVPADWFSTKPIGPTYVPGNTSNKRQRRTSVMHSLPAILNAPESPTRRLSRPRKAKSTSPQM